MKTHEALAIHEGLHDPSKTAILTGEVGEELADAQRRLMWPITRRENRTQSFAMVDIGTYRCVTQNLRKPSENTDWVLKHPGGRLTWFIRTDVHPNVYVGRVREFDDEEGFHVVELHSLRPEKRRYHQRTKKG